MQRKSEFLNFKPSEQAAAAYLLAINISRSEVAAQVGLKYLPDLIKRAEQLRFSGPQSQSDTYPLHMWTEYIESLTKIKAETSIKPVYKILVSSLNQKLFQ